MREKSPVSRGSMVPKLINPCCDAFAHYEVHGDDATVCCNPDDYSTIAIVLRFFMQTTTRANDL